jgi:VIT1/CCC1 family predicted Fe2+/Mn2+ transporter
VLTVGWAVWHAPLFVYRPGYVSMDGDPVTSLLPELERPAERDVPNSVRPSVVRVAEVHRSGRTGWLRAGVLGANDGLLSTASLIVGVAASGSSRASILISGIAGLVAGAMSMAAGEYVSVSSQADTENADLARERRELASDEPAERAELAAIYVARGLTPELATRVAEQLMAKDALGAHARDELGLTDTSAARPVQAALVSALTFSVGALLPVIVAAAAPREHAAVLVTGSALALLALLGVVAALIGGAAAWRGALRMTFWGLLAMGVSAAIGRLVGGAM